MSLSFPCPCGRVHVGVSTWKHVRVDTPTWMCVHVGVSNWAYLFGRVHVYMGVPINIQVCPCGRVSLDVSMWACPSYLGKQCSVYIYYSKYRMLLFTSQQQHNSTCVIHDIILPENVTTPVTTPVTTTTA